MAREVHTSVHLRDHDVERLCDADLSARFDSATTTGSRPRPADPTPSVSWRYWFWNFHGSQMGWQSNLKHQMYIEGRLDSHLSINNIRDNRLEGMQHRQVNAPVRQHPQQLPERGTRRAAISRPACARTSSSTSRAPRRSSSTTTNWSAPSRRNAGAFERTRVPARAPRHVGRRLAGIPQSQLRSARQARNRPGFAPPGFTAGPETFVNPEFWEAVRSYDIADPANPYSFKHYVAYNRFRWLDEGTGASRCFATTGRRRARFTRGRRGDLGHGAAQLVGTQRHVLREQSLRGLAAADMTNPQRWFELDNHAAPSLVTKHGPGPWAYPPPPRPVVFVGGEQHPGEQPAPIDMPNWFRL